MYYDTVTYYLDRPVQPGRIYDIFIPETVQHDTAIFIIHGGGWKAGSRLGYHTPIMDNIVQRGYIVATADYRLDVSVFEQLKDCREAYMHFVNELRKMGRPVKIAVHGTSAGAHLAGLLTIAEPGAAGEEFHGEWVAPECGLFQSLPRTFEPWDEILPYLWKDMQFAVRTPYEEAPELYKKLSFDRYLHSEMPRIFLMEAEYEEMFFYPTKLSLAREIAAMNNRVSVKIYKNMEHGFLFNLDRVHQREALEDLLKFIEGSHIDGLEFEA
jgi:acetyl esterase/lipase